MNGNKLELIALLFLKPYNNVFCSSQLQFSITD